MLLLALLLLVPAALGLAGCSGDTQASEDGAASGTPDDGPEAVPVEVATLGRGSMEEVLRFSTNLEAEESVGVHAQASRQVVELRVEEGDRVETGDVLVRLQDDEQRNELARVKGQLARARREYDRQESLWRDQLISEQAYNEATYDLEQLELALEEARRQLSYTVVRAPISGTVTRRLVNLGDQITVNQHLFDIVDFDTLVARVYVPEKELAKLHPGLPARITASALGREPYEGRVERIAPVVDPGSGTVKVTVGIPDWRGLRPGLYVDVALVTAVHDEAVRVPKRALLYDQDQVFLYRVVDGEGEGRPAVERVAVRPLLEDAEAVEPAGDALGPGDRVVVAGQAGLKAGTPVRVLDRAPEGVAP
ncbi:MAG: efflux RND transporter periplasmic adaptor subunit [Thermoanaerobaculia bacterium]